MATNDPERLRISTWPGVVVPVPPVRRVPFEAVDDYLVLMRRDPGTAEPLPDELAIRDLRAVDCLDREAVLSFVRDHGTIARTSKESELLLEVTEPARPAGATPHWIYWKHVAAHLWQAQLLAAHAVAHLDGDYVLPVWRRFTGFCPDEDAAWLWFQEALNKAIGWYSTRVEVVLPLRTFDIPGAMETMTKSGLPEIGLYSALCLQVFNILTEGLPTHECANERCDNRFIRQDGRAKAGQYRTVGVDYCSDRCAKAQAQRNHYDRKKAEKARAR